jgi:hypothetical protein
MRGACNNHSTLLINMKNAKSVSYLPSLRKHGNQVNIQPSDGHPNEPSENRNEESSRHVNILDTKRLAVRKSCGSSSHGRGVLRVGG